MTHGAANPGEPINESSSPWRSVWRNGTAARGTKASLEATRRANRFVKRSIIALSVVDVNKLFASKLEYLLPAIMSTGPG